MLHHRVLLIEDDPDTIKLLSVLFKLEKIEIQMPDDLSEDAILTQIKTHHYDRLLVDVNVSQINGIDLVRRIRSEVTDYHPFILMLSGLNMEESCIHAGADVFFQKPYDPSRLIQLLKAQKRSSVPSHQSFSTS